MSGIAGVWNVTGAPADRGVVARMAAALRHRGPDGERLHVSGSAGFLHQHSWVTPEEIGEEQPLAGGRNVVVAWDGRLDNRGDLLPVLDLPPSSSDAACVLSAYLRWGVEFPARLLGDFAVAVFDPAEQRLVLARDAIGIRPLYYFRAGGVFAFGSEIKALLAHPRAPRGLDNEGLADFLLIGSRPVDRQDITCFAGISAVIPSHTVVVTARGVRVARYWDFDTGHALHLGSLDEYRDGFRHLFAQAVGRRVRSAHPVAVSVSGGLDSSSIFCQAERLRRHGAAACPALVGISYLGPQGSDADERRYLVDIEREYGVEIERFPMEDFPGVVHGVEDQLRAIEAPFLDYQWGVTQEAGRRAAAGGARVVLSGHWGDQVLFSPAYLIDLIGGLSFRQVGAHLREYSRWFGPEEAGTLARRLPMDLLRHHTPGPLRQPLKWIRRRLFGGERPKRWFSDSFLRAALRFADRPAEIGAGFHSAQARSIYLEARSKYHVQCMEWNNKIAALHGQEAAFPFLDRDLLAFLMAIPGEIQNHGGVPRAILREAMRGVLPEPVRQRTWKADFTDPVNEGVAGDLAEIRRRLGPDCLAVRLGYVDPARLAPELERLAKGLERDDCLDSWDLVDLFSLEAWLEIFSIPRDAVDRPVAPLMEESVA